MKYRVICDRCGRKRWNHELRKEWTGLMVCSDTCWEARHPQDRVRGRPDRQAPPWTRPEPADTFNPNDLLVQEDSALILLEVSDSLSLVPDALALEDA